MQAQMFSTLFRYLHNVICIIEQCSIGVLKLLQQLTDSVKVLHVPLCRTRLAAVQAFPEILQVAGAVSISPSAQHRQEVCFEEKSRDQSAATSSTMRSACPAAKLVHVR